MNITRAIEILQDLNLDGNLDIQPDEHNALNLGIEALKLVKLTHENYGMSFGAILPGETKG